MSKPEPLTAGARVEVFEGRLKASGGRIIHKVRLKPPAAEALAKLERAGRGSPTAIINQLLEQAAEDE